MRTLNKILAAIVFITSAHVAVAEVTASNTLNLTIPPIVTLAGNSVYSLDSSGLVNTTTGLPTISTNKEVSSASAVVINSNIGTARLTVSGLDTAFTGALTSSATVSDTTNFTNKLQFNNLRFLHNTNLVADFSATTSQVISFQSNTALNKIRFDVPSNDNNIKRLVPGTYTAIVGLTVSES